LAQVSQTTLSVSCLPIASPTYRVDAGCSLASSGPGGMSDDQGVRGKDGKG